MKKIAIIAVVILFFVPVNSSFNERIYLNNSQQFCQKNLYNSDDTDYWAVLIGVGIYAGYPDEDRPYMLTAVDKMHDLLIQSGNWKEEHIKVLKGEECTAINIVKALKWLDEKDDENDISLVYITTHGFKGSTI